MLYFFHITGKNGIIPCISVGTAVATVVPEIGTAINQLLLTNFLKIMYLFTEKIRIYNNQNKPENDWGKIVFHTSQVFDGGSCSESPART